ncbi:MAG TPA: K+/H+ antiporter subunit F [Kiloniellaceae bacterium]
MIAYALTFAFGCFGLAMLLTFYRLAKGPSLADRILALDTLVVNSIAVLVLYGIYSDSFAYFEAALLFTMLGFVSTVAYCRFILRGDIIE